MSRSLVISACFVIALGTGSLAPLSAQQAARDPSSGILPQAVGEPDVSLANWGTLASMIEPMWVTQGLAVPRSSATSWLIPGKVLIIRHGTTERMKLGEKYADVVQRIELNPSTRKFTITYSYENGRTLSATGQIEADGTFSETLISADGSQQRNLYLLDDPRKMRLVRQKRSGTGWANVSSVTKIGETPGEKFAREDADRRDREAKAAAAKRRQAAKRAAEEAEEEAYYAELDAQAEMDAAEEAEQRQRTQNVLRKSMQNFIDHNARIEEGSRQLQENIRAQIARKEAQDRRAQEDAQRVRDGQRQQADANAQAAREQAQRAESERQRLAQQRQADEAQRQQQAAQAERQRAADAKKRAESELVSWKEGVVICEPPKSGTGEWACHGPLQTTYGQPDKPSGAIAVRQACGSSSGEDQTRELGQSGGYRTYGCGFGTNPANAPNRDPSVRLGVFVPGRTTFTCPKNQTTVCKQRN